MRLKRNNRKKTQYRRRVVFIVAFLPICAGVIQEDKSKLAASAKLVDPPSFVHQRVLHSLYARRPNGRGL
jgi:hypothetical protein